MARQVQLEYTRALTWLAALISVSFCFSFSSSCESDDTLVGKN